MGNRKPVCIIPARGGSQRIPHKNLALLAGKPLLAYAIEAAQESERFAMICVSSDDEDVLEVARMWKAQALRRPPELATDTAQVWQVCAHLLESFEAQGQSYEEFGVLLTTNPLRTADDLRAAYARFKQSDANYCMSLVPYNHPPQRAVWMPEGYVQSYFGIEYMRPAQAMEQLYRHDGTVIFGKTTVFLKERGFYGTKIVPYFMPRERSVDIDNPLDLAWAEFLLTHTPLQGPVAAGRR